jgi:transcriptional regulator with XRE-family HTH domain
VTLTTGEVIRMLRELKDWTQAELAERSGVSPTNISALENNRIEIGKHRAEHLAKAFGIHPGIIMFPDHEPSLEKWRGSADFGLGKRRSAIVRAVRELRDPE